eukprot:Phypoly_transcript_07683.p1 GENE.Phypoly_transcript_07683~~Phypoly_transcript_07683.p1  ORF type:complete len:485 (+),score=48.53 Phypoly_transcript_07683:116-1570(+)
MMIEEEISLDDDESSNKDVTFSSHILDTGEVDYSVEENKLQKKAAIHIMPIVYLLFFFAFLDRANLANMHQSLLEDIPMSETQFGFALGVFYISYVLFQLPANIMLEYLRAKKWIAMIAFSWGLVTVFSTTISSVTLLAIFRFLLGLTEAGLAPALMLYIRMWFNNKYRAQAISIFMMSIPASNFVSGLISGFVISSTDGLANLSGWQWLYIIEGLPTLVMAVVVLILLPNSPSDAKFITYDELIILLQKQQQDDERMHRHSKNIQKISKEEVLDTLQEGRNWVLSFIGFCLMIASAGVSGFLPTILYEFGTLTKSQSNLLSSVPNFIALFFLYFWSRRSDQKGERFWHSTSALVLAIWGLLFCALSLLFGSLWYFLLSSIVYNIGFWAGSSIFLTHGVSNVAGSPAIGIALFNSIYTSGGWAGPFAMGVLRDHTGDHIGGLLLCCCSLILSLFGLFVFRHRYSSKTSRFVQIEMTDMHESEED